MTVSTAPATTPAPRTLHDVPGWFFWADQQLFEQLLTAPGPDGHLVELGAYLGKSAVLVGRHRRPGERFVVCDLFGADADDEQNATENAGSYASLTREAFERNYLSFHESLPEVLQAPSARIVDHLPGGSARFVHVDASHLYEHVSIDVRSARHLLREDGVVVFDDWRAEHTPGVAAAVWEAVACLGLTPFVLTPHKLYGTFGDAAPHLASVRAWLAGTSGSFRTSEQQIRGATVLRVKHVRPAAPADDRPVPPTPTRAPAAHSRSTQARPSAVRAVARDLLPPVLVRAVRASRRRRAG